MTGSPSPPHAPNRQSDRFLNLGFLAVLVWSLIRLPPWRPLFVVESDGVDPSWLALLNEATAGGWHFGRDILFTYGPLGFLHGRVYHPQTYPLLIAGWLTVACVLAATLWRITRPIGVAPLTRLAGIFLAVEMLSRDVMALCFSLQAALFLIVVPLQHRPQDSLFDDPSPKRRSILELVHRLLLVLLIAALPWVKFSYLPSVAGLTLCTGLAALRHRRFPFEAVGLVLGSLSIWFATGHTTGDLRGYLSSGLELSRGYSAAMGTGPQTLSGWTAVISAAVIALTLPWWLAERGWTRSADRWLGAAFFGGLLFLMFKSAFVRWHPDKLATFLIPVVLLLLSGWQCHAAREWIFRRRWISPVLIPAVALFCAAWISCSGLGSSRPLLSWLSGPAVLQAASLFNQAGDDGWLRRTHQRRLAEIRQANPIPPVEGSVDAFPSKLVVPLAHGLDLQPRPVIQSYAAYTHELLEVNRAHLAGAAAPRHVLLSVSAIDNRLATMDDGPAWLQLLRGYQPVAEVGGMLRLDRLPVPRDWHRELVHAQTLDWNTPWCCDESPALSGPDGWLLAMIDCRPNLTGQLATTLYRLPPVRLQIEVGSRVHEFRLIPECARAGFLLAPLVTMSCDARGLWRPWLPDAVGVIGGASADCGDRLRTLTLTTPIESCFDERIDFELWRLTPQYSHPKGLPRTTTDDRRSRR